jgi:hypothetical protein
MAADYQAAVVDALVDLVVGAVDVVQELHQ